MAYHSRRSLMPVLRHGALLGALCAGAACKDINVPNTNNPGISQLTGTPTIASVLTATQGVLIASRALAGTASSGEGILGREIILVDAIEVRNINSYLTGPLDPQGFIADFGWTNTYRSLALQNAILTAVDKLKDTDLSPTDKESIRGFVKTFQAADLLNLIRIRDTLGIAIDVSGDARAPMPAIVGKDDAYARIFQLLDQAKTHLQAAGPKFPFLLTTGFTANGTFNTPATFLKFNRALRARADIDRKKYPDALTDLTASFLDAGSGSNLTATQLKNGVYFAYNTAGGGTANPNYDPKPTRLVVDSFYFKDAQLRADATRDLRATTKASVATSPPPAVLGVSSNLRSLLYATPNDPIPIIRNEELVLARAEARYFTNDKAGALADINLIRRSSGGLADRALFTDDTDFLSELIYNRRYSLFFEQGVRWIDARRFGRLATLPKYQPSHKIFPYVPFPADECAARASNAPVGCNPVPGQ